MKHSKRNFKALVAKMDQLQETDQGKLKGGIKVLSVTPSDDLIKETNYALCGATNVYCPKK